MKEAAWREYRALDQPLLFQHGLCVLAGIAHMYDGVAYRELEILAYVGVKTHYITILDRLFPLAYLVVEPHGLGSTTVQSVACV